MVHRRSSDSTPPLSGEGWIWRTCLRELQFLVPHTEPESDALRGTAAHRFLLEICSGLHSPLFGETEVFGQFKAFREAQVWPSGWHELFDAVEEDVRKLRRTHLLGVGSQSYGSLARRHLQDGAEVVLLGGGRLALDLLPWLSKCSLTVALRNPEKWGRENPAVKQVISLAQLRSPQSELHQACWILAAPVTNGELQHWWKINSPSVILDFRGESAFAKDEAPGHYLPLKSLYGELENVRQLHEKKRADALAYAEELSRVRAARYAASAIHRPFGWEDAYP